MRGLLPAGRLAVGVVIALELGGCGPSMPASNCPNQQTPTCPSVAPSFMADVDPAIGTYCRGCHSPEGVEANRPFTTYAEIKPQAGAMLSQLFNCFMPPADAPQPTDAARAALLGWLACGAPQN